ncbi:MAG: hypothetical protein JSV84_05105 [Gemmatimonadota bacterium]|nr:MAG: hypothetical protein JSV84_05105 [Gemmatimonadota bacterium]
MSMFSLFDMFRTGAWIDYAIIIVFTLIALFLVGHFMRQGPRRWLAFAGILLGGGLALSWTARRHRYTEKKLKAHNEAIERLRAMVAKRDQMIEENNATIRELEAERANLRPDIDEDKAKIREIEEKIDARRRNHERMAKVLDMQEEDIAGYVKRMESESPLLSVGEILTKHGLAGKRPETQPTVPDPAGPEKRAEAIAVAGFVMKGDVE